MHTLVYSKYSISQWIMSCDRAHCQSEGIPACTQGHAPAGVEFVDEEEEYVVDAQGRGSWQPVPKR